MLAPGTAVTDSPFQTHPAAFVCRASEGKGSVRAKASGPFPALRPGAQAALRTPPPGCVLWARGASVQAGATDLGGKTESPNLEAGPPPAQAVVWNEGPGLPVSAARDLSCCLEVGRD